jgi:hypothetical protein
LACWQENPVLVKIDYDSVALQTTINQKLPALNSALTSGLLTQASEILDGCLILCEKITHPQDVQTLGYISLANMQQSLADLKSKLNAHRELATDQITYLLTYLRANIKNFTTLPFADYLLQQTSELLSQNWVKLYAVDIKQFSQNFTTAINAAIVDSKKSSYIFGCYQQRYTLDNIQISNLIEKLIKDAQPTINLQLELPLLNLNKPISPKFINS